MTDADKAPAPGRLDHLGIEQLRQRPPARLGREAFGLTAFRLHPVAEMGEQRDQIFLQPVCQKQWNATGCEYLHDLMDKALGHGPRARTNRDRQQQLALRVDRRPDPMRRARQTVDRLIFAHLPVLHGAEHGIQLIKLYLLYMHRTQDVACKGLKLLGCFDQPVQHRIGGDLEDSGGGANTEPLG